MKKKIITKQSFYIDLTDNDGNLYTFSILIGKDLGKNEIIIIDHNQSKQKTFKQIKRATKYFNKKKIRPEELKKVIELNNKIMRLRDSEKRTFTSPPFGVKYSKEINRKSSKK